MVTGGFPHLNDYPDHPERLEHWAQVLCREGLSRRCYWEVEWNRREAELRVEYKGIRRRGMEGDSLLGSNSTLSWNYKYDSVTDCQAQ